MVTLDFFSVIKKRKVIAEFKIVKNRKVVNIENSNVLKDKLQFRYNCNTNIIEQKLETKVAIENQ